jgi:hypothetical protein
MKIVVGAIITLLLSLNTATNLETEHINNYLTASENKDKYESQDEVFKKIFLTCIISDIEKIINSHYNESVMVDFTSIDILSIKRPFGEHEVVFDISLKITPFTGAHNTVGEDILTIRVEPGAKCFKVLDYKHIK